jgi:hypothetical protein
VHDTGLTVGCGLYADALQQQRCQPTMSMPGFSNQDGAMQSRIPSVELQFDNVAEIQKQKEYV